MTGPSNPEVRRTLLAGLAGVLGVLTLKGLLSDYGWIVDAWLTIVVVVAPAVVIRLWRRPGAFDIWVGVILMIPWLTLRFVPDHAFLGLIPTGGTVHDISRLMTQLHETSSSETAPIHSTPAVRLVVCALIGLLAALIDLIAVVGRRSALAGIPLLVVYTVSGAVSRQAVAWGWFVAAAAGFLLLLSLDASRDRSSWGHHVGRAQTMRTKDAWGHSAPRLGAAAIVLAVLLPFVIPIPSNNLIADALRDGDNGSGGFGAGSGSGGSISPFASLKGELRQGADKPLMTVHVDGPASTVPFYLRSNVLGQYDDDKGWEVGTHGTTEPIQSSRLETQPEFDRPAANRYTADITITGLTGNVPIFAALNRVDGVRDGTDWSSQDQLLVGPSVKRNQHVFEDVQQPAPTVQDLLAAQPAGTSTVSQWLTKPALPKYVVDLVASLTGQVQGQYAKARAISNYFADPANGFTYSLNTKDAGSGSELVDFLQTKQGYCQQYAAAMAIMLRQAGVPSRVVLGYMHSAPDKSGNFTVTSHDAHAWVEAYFSGEGWVPFDPTPIAGLAGGSKSDLPWAPHAYPKSTGAGTDAPAPHASTPAPSASQAAPTAAVPSVAAPAATTSSGSGNVSIVVLVAILAGVALIVFIPASVRGARRRRHLAAARRGDADALWAELSDSALDLGYVWSAARTPRQVAEWLGADAQGSGTTLTSLAVAVERQRYGGGGASPDTVEPLMQPVHQVTEQLRAQRSARTRVLSRLWPASLGWRPLAGLTGVVRRAQKRRH